jgi:hypothetical protein
MNHRSIVFIAAAALAPALSQASPEKTALEACSHTFAASLAAPGATPPTYKVVYRPTDEGTVAGFFAREYTFYLRANDKKTGAAVARASCSTDAYGNVVAFTAVPDAGFPNLASRTE